MIASSLGQMPHRHLSMKSNLRMLLGVGDSDKFRRVHEHEYSDDGAC